MSREIEEIVDKAVEEALYKAFNKIGAAIVQNKMSVSEANVAIMTWGEDIYASWRGWLEVQ